MLMTPSEQSPAPSPSSTPTPQSLGLVCLTPSLGGLELNLIRLAQWLGAQAVEVFFFAQPGSPSYLKAQQFGLQVFPLTKRRKYMDWKAARTLRSFCLQHQIQNLICSDNQDLDLILWTKALTRQQLMKTFYLQQMLVGVNKRDLAHTLKYRWLDHWLAPLDWLKVQALERTRIAESKVISCPLGVDTERFSSLALTRSEARAEMNLPQELFLFGLVGRTDPGKGIHTLIEAFNEVAAQEPEVGLVVVSAFPKEGGEHWDYAQKIHRMREESPHKDRIFFRPFTDQVEKAFRSLDGFVMASLCETVGMVTIEAMLSRIPVIGANSAGTPELLDFGRAGLLFEVENPRDLAQKMSLLKRQHKNNMNNSSEDELGSMIHRAFERAQTNYSAKKMCDIIRSQML